jgi:hypothetical protein
MEIKCAYQFSADKARKVETKNYKDGSSYFRNINRENLSA